MKFFETQLKGAFIIEPERMHDERGFFARAWCKREFEANGLDPDIVQCNLSFNYQKGTLRGLHHQIAPYEEAKIVRCISGAIYDVIVDIRSQSPTYKQWISIKLTADNKKMLFIPQGVSHGFLTLADNTEVFYQMSNYYHPECARGIRYNDPVFKIDWLENINAISEKDLNYPDFK